jgi:flagellar hook protein FlgE
VSTSQGFVDGGGALAAAGTRLTDLRTAAAPGVALFAAGDTITVSGVTKGGREMPARQFVVGTDGNTLNDLASWMQTQFGIETAAGAPGNPGVTVENGTLVVRSNTGDENAIEIGNSDFTSTNAGSPLPFTFTETSPSVGTGLFTSFTVYDSLGAPIPVNATFMLDSTPNSGPVWRYYLESGEPNASPRNLGTGTVSFDTDGNFVSTDGNQFSLDRSNTGAASPLTFSIDFNMVNGLSTRASDVIMAEQDGYPPGTLTNYAIDTDGTIVGIFSNSLTQNLGQVAVATFTNELGLVAESENLFAMGPNSSQPRILEPGTLNAGTVRSGALEMSNVDLSREFIGLITSSTAFQAASRLISTSNEMLDQLMLTLR